MLKSLARIKRTTKVILWAVICVVVFVGVIVGWDAIGRWLAAIGGGLVVLLGGKKVLNQERQASTKETIEQQRTIKADLDNRSESWRDKVNKLRRGSLILIICTALCLTAGTIRAEDLYMPDDYDELRSLYILAIELLDEADQIILEYQSLTADQTTTIQEQVAMIDKLQKDIFKLSRPSWGITGGIDLANNHAQWRLGVARKKGIISFGGGVGGGDGFSLWGEVGLWIR